MQTTSGSDDAGGLDTTGASFNAVAAGTVGAADIAELGYEQARDELVEVVRRLEAGAATLEESLRLWERGEALAARCEEWLAGARAQLDRAIDARAAREDAG